MFLLKFFILKKSSFLGSKSFLKFHPNYKIFNFCNIVLAKNVWKKIQDYIDCSFKVIGESVKIWDLMNFAWTLNGSSVNNILITIEIWEKIYDISEISVICFGHKFLPILNSSSEFRQVLQIRIFLKNWS